MNRTLWNESDRKEIIDRISSLTPDRKPLWGSMNGAQMLAHAADPLRHALGEMTVAPKGGPFGVFPLKQLIVYWLPWPKGAPTAPEFVHAAAEDWARNRTELAALIERFAQSIGRARFPPHVVFGKLSDRAWGVLMWRHLDHHLRQFGA